MKTILKNGCSLGTLLFFYTASSIAATPSIGCGERGLRSGIHTVEHGGHSRTFRLHVPRGYDRNQASPLVTLFHGWGGNENEFLNDRSVRAEANARGYILAAPRGLGSGAPDSSFNSWSFSGSTTGLDGDGINSEVPEDTAAICDDAVTADYSYASCDGIAVNSCSWTHCQDDDVDFAVAMVEYIGENLCVDEGNVFASGGSNGGMFSWELGQNAKSAPTFRAIAPLIGLPHRAHLAAQGKADDMPVLLITGKNDRTVPPGTWRDSSYTTTSDGDKYYYTGATGITQVWAAEHACNTSDNAVPFDDGYPQTQCKTYCSDDEDWPRVLDCRAQMGHSYNLIWAWPLIMDFFDHHSVD
jgi:poly(3-hydroxybutyrate) depolymerase